MSASDNNNTVTATTAAPTLGQKLARMIDDPVGSVVVGTAFPTAAVMFIAGGMYSIGLIY
jgi:hypothetical protein